VALGGTYRQAQPTGGGAVGDAQLDASGNYNGGSITYNNVTSVTLQSRTAALLLNP